MPNILRDINCYFSNLYVVFVLGDQNLIFILFMSFFTTISKITCYINNLCNQGNYYLYCCVSLYNPSVYYNNIIIIIMQNKLVSHTKKPRKHGNVIKLF